MDTRSPSKTRRFQSHSEAMRWSFGSLTRWWMKLLPACILGTIIHFAVGYFLTDEYPGMMFLAFIFVGFPAVIWFAVAPAIYVCVVLAGGVMSR